MQSCRSNDPLLIKDRFNAYKKEISFQEIDLDGSTLVFVTAREDGIWMTRVDLSHSETSTEPSDKKRKLEAGE